MQATATRSDVDSVESEIESTITRLAQQGIGGPLVRPDARFNGRPKRLVALAAWTAARSPCALVTLALAITKVAASMDIGMGLRPLIAASMAAGSMRPHTNHLVDCSIKDRY